MGQYSCVSVHCCRADFHHFKDIHRHLCLPYCMTTTEIMPLSHIREVCIIITSYIVITFPKMMIDKHKADILGGIERGKYTNYITSNSTMEF